MLQNYGDVGIKSEYYAGTHLKISEGKVIVDKNYVQRIIWWMGFSIQQSSVSHFFSLYVTSTISVLHSPIGI